MKAFKKSKELEAEFGLPSYFADLVQIEGLSSNEPSNDSAQNSSIQSTSIQPVNQMNEQIDLNLSLRPEDVEYKDEFYTFGISDDQMVYNLTLKNGKNYFTYEPLNKAQIKFIRERIESILSNHFIYQMKPNICQNYATFKAKCNMK